jgi:hypothetical protein
MSDAIRNAALWFMAIMLVGIGFGIERIADALEALK